MNLLGKLTLAVLVIGLAYLSSPREKERREADQQGVEEKQTRKEETNEKRKERIDACLSSSVVASRNRLQG